MVAEAKQASGVSAFAEKQGGLVASIALVVLMELVAFQQGINALDVLVSGLALGALYAVIALGYTLVYGIIELINFAHGDVFAFGGFVSLTLMERLDSTMVNSGQYLEGKHEVSFLGITANVDAVWLAIGT